MPRARSLLAVVGLLASGLGLHALGERTIELEAREAHARARARAEDAVRVARDEALPRLAQGLGPTWFRLRRADVRGRFEAMSASAAPEDRLLFEQALFLARRGDAVEAADLFTRLAQRPGARDLAPLAAAHAAALAATDDRVPAAQAPAPEAVPTDAVTEDGVPLRAWTAYLRVRAALRAADRAGVAAAWDALGAAFDGEGVRTDGGPDAADCVLAAVDAGGPALTEALAAAGRPDPDDLVLRARVARAAAGRPPGAAARLVGAVIVASVPEADAPDRVVRAADFVAALATTLAVPVAAALAERDVPPDASRAQPAALEGLWLYAVPDPGPIAGPFPRWLLAGGLAAYLLGGWALLAASARRRHAQRMQADFVAAVSHELKTPIAGVKALAEMLADERVEDPERRRLYAQRIGAEMDRLGAAVSDVLDAARIERDPTAVVRPRLVEPADAVAAAVEIARPALARRGVALSATVAPSGARMPIDPDALAHVVHNLLDNAAKFAGDRGEVTLVAGPSADGYRVEVLDRGPGIPADERARVFERFFRGADARRRAVPGTGLGLHVARALVEAHGGRVGATDRDGGGARLVVDLPRRPA